MIITPDPTCLPRLFLILLLWCLPAVCPALPGQFSVAATTQTLPTEDSVVTIAAGKKYLRSGFHRFWFGKHYRRVWAEPVTVPVFKNPGEHTTLTPLKMGGSYQTKNLRLADDQGREYVLRSIDKDPSRALPPWLQNTFVAGLMKDQTSVIHPYGAFIVPELAKAAGIYHTNPRLVYLPDNVKLGEFSEEFAGMLMLLEERPEGNRKDMDSFGNSENIKSSASAFNDIYSNNCNQIDAAFYLRNRLFDMLIGDWSRREDQWRWATFQENGKTIYKAIPRDRDHAFFLFDDGVITRVISWFKPTYQTFSEDFENIEGLNETGRPTDDFFLAMLPEEVFVATANDLKDRLTDEVIRKAVSGWPPNIYELTGEEFIRKLKSRRDRLPAAAREYYRILNKNIIIPGTDKAETFKIQRLGNGEVKISVWNKNNKCQADSLIAKKTFTRKHTRKISLYGLDGKDEFRIGGTGKKKIKIRIYPGAGKDDIYVDSEAIGRKARTRIYTTGDGDEFYMKSLPSVKDNNDIKAKEYDANGWLLRHRLH